MRYMIHRLANKLGGGYLLFHLKRRRLKTELEIFD